MMLDIERGLTAERLREILHYDPVTGEFTWLVSLSPRIRVGERAGSLNSQKYLHIQVGGCKYQAHRLAWLYMTGEWPKEQVDHINCKRADNRWTNLRSASQSQNIANGRRRRNNTSGFKGVSKQGKYWQAQIQMNGVLHYLGLYKNPEDAHAAYCVAAAELHGEFSRVA